MKTESTNIELQWQQARSLLANGKNDEALFFLESAASAAHPAAAFNLGCLHLFSLIGDADRKRGIELIQKAADVGHGGAFYRLAMLELAKADKQPNWNYANECLWRSAELRHPLALRSLAVHWGRGSDPELLRLGTLCLEHAAEGGDMVSLALLMQRLFQGIGCEKNVVRASAINTLLVDTPLDIEAPDSPVSPDRAPLPHLPALPPLPLPRLQDDQWSPATEMISESPWICVAENAVTPEECWLLRHLSYPHLTQSITAESSGKQVKSSIRTSYDVELEEVLEDISLLLLQRRMAIVAGTTPAYSEYLRVLRYEQGQQYLPHRDYLPSSYYIPLEQGGAGQRESTVIVYLNDMANGGETKFIELGKKIAPKAGRLLAFRNLHPDGSPDRRTLHAGLPVSSGSKWIATLWIHQGIYRA